MNKKVKELLAGRGGNYILPFFWQHGEDEATLREYMRVIHNSNIGEVCVESRPHPDFCGPKWWQDMDAILDEAKKLGMKVWILDDSHFPTGFCNGALVNGPDELRRQSVTGKVLAQVKAGESVTLDRAEYEKPTAFQPSIVEQYLKCTDKTFDDDVLLGVIAVKDGGSRPEDLLLLEEQNKNCLEKETGSKCQKNSREEFAGKESCKLTESNEKNIASENAEKQPEEEAKEKRCIRFTAEDGGYTLYACHLTRNRGPHRDYMNMCDAESCHKLIEAVYEPHYAHYKEEFGKTIAGFFSDEPEIGNGHLYEMGKTLPEVEDQPWSREVQAELIGKWGENWVSYLPLLWNESFSGNLTAKVRYDFMDTITRKVEKDFSWQIGDWCRAHGVEYIGHLIEDDHQHSRCGSSLGHFFRGLSGEDMAGIDDIGEQVLPQGEDIQLKKRFGGMRDGVFYHYALGKLGASAAAIEPQKKGRAMCEIFGNYGWQEGTYLEKYLADHFMVRGINHFVPHAFSAKAFPDPDCPPHFYAHGHNPQYRHFGRLMEYMNRVCELISDGHAEVPVAILYHGEADWAGGKCMYSQEPARRLADHQIDYHFIPSDVFSEAVRASVEEAKTGKNTDKSIETESCEGRVDGQKENVHYTYGTVLGKTLKVNKQEYRALIVPECSYVTADFAKAAAALLDQGFPVIFINSLPEGICSQGEKADRELLQGLQKAAVVSLEEIVSKVEAFGIGEIKTSPAWPLLRCLHYENGSDMYYFVNEAAESFDGTITIAHGGSCYCYNAWENRLEKAPVVCKEASEGALRKAEKEDTENAESAALLTGEACNTTTLKLHLEPRKSLILFFDEAETEPAEGAEQRLEEVSHASQAWQQLPLNTDWSRSTCGAISYPAFDAGKQVSLPDLVEKELPDFGGFIRYEKIITLPALDSALLEITDAAEAVEVFINGVSAGIQIVPTFVYDLSKLLKEGENELRIEVATTLERVKEVQKEPRFPGEVIPKPSNHCGLTGQVTLYYL